MDLNTPGIQHDVRVTVSVNFGGNVKAFLSYSEAKDTGSGSPCYFPGTNGGLFFNLRADACMVFPAGGGTFSFETGGLDGTGTWFLILERTAGTTGSATACIEDLATGLPPSNDRCSAPIILTVGSGIDANTATGGTGTWSYGFDGNIRYATKQRMQNGCGGGNPNTEDHFHHTNLGGCYVNRSLGTIISGLGAANSCVTSIQNSVYFRFNTPPGSPTNNWFLHIGNMDCPYQPNQIEVILFSSMDCNNARNSTRIGCWANVSRKFNFPLPDSVLALPALNPATTYWIVVDGVRGSQCNFKMLLTRSVTNPVLPVEIVNLEAVPGEVATEVRWQTAGESNLAGFEIQRSVDGVDFDDLGWQTAMGNVSGSGQYVFSDRAPLSEKSYYRLRIEDLDGSQSFSQVVEVFRNVQTETRISSLRFDPGGTHLELSFSTAAKGPVVISCVDVQGRLAAEWKGMLDAGNHDMQLPAADWARGIYLIRISASGEHLSGKVIR